MKKKKPRAKRVVPKPALPATWGQMQPQADHAMHKHLHQQVHSRRFDDSNTLERGDGHDVVLRWDGADLDMLRLNPIPDGLAMGQTILVKWRDPTGFSGWRDGPIESSPVTTLGYFVARTEHDLVVAGSHCKDKDEPWGGLDAIPMGCVVEVRRINTEDKA